jgi:hypothetical protein
MIRRSMRRERPCPLVAVEISAIVLLVAQPASALEHARSLVEDDF